MFDKNAILPFALSHISAYALARVQQRVHKPFAPAYFEAFSTIGKQTAPADPNS